MKPITGFLAIAMLSLTSGCVERRFVVYSDPPGALVYHNGLLLSQAPADGSIVYYGKHHFQLIKEGYETLDVVQEYSPPWYEWPGLDFIAENLWPFKLRDVRKFSYTMTPLQSIPPDDVRFRAEELRLQGRAIGAPRPPSPGQIPAPPATQSAPGQIPTPPEGALPVPRTMPPPPETPLPGVNGP